MSVSETVSEDVIYSTAQQSIERAGDGKVYGGRASWVSDYAAHRSLRTVGHDDCHGRRDNGCVAHKKNE